MKILNRTLKALPLIALGVLMLLAFVPKNTLASTVTNTDFQAQSFSKTVDWYDYVRQYAAANNFTPPSPNEHAYIYANYINVGVFEHFKTPNGKDAITASSFISLISFKENSSDIYPNSPDRNDTVYASFSLGVNLTALTGHPVPSYVATSTVIPLTSTDSNHWTWGLDYTNLNAIWWKVNPDPLFPTYDRNTPRGLAQYTELKFTYALAIDPASKTATLTESYTVGRITNLWILAPGPAIHLNAAGTYNLDGSLNKNKTVYQFLTPNQFKLSN